MVAEGRLREGGEGETGSEDGATLPLRLFLGYTERYMPNRTCLGFLGLTIDVVVDNNCLLAGPKIAGPN